MSYTPNIGSLVSTNNSTTATLGGAGVYTGTGEDVSQYSMITVFVHSDVASASKGLELQLSTDNTNWDRAKSITMVANASQTAFGGVFTLAVVSQYFRVKYTNGGGAQAEFRLQTIYHGYKSKFLTSSLDQTISDQVDVELVRAAIMGQRPDSNFASVPVNPEGLLRIDLPFTAFGDLRSTQLVPQFQGSFEYTVDNTELNTNTEVAGGTVTQSTAMAVINTSATTGSSAEFKSKFHAKYRPGFGGNARFTALFTTGTAGTDQLAGLLDETGSSQPYKNGYSIGYLGTTFGVHRFVNDTVVTTALASCDDPLDGTGRSGMTIDQTQINVFQIQFQYLGAGAIIYSIEDPLTGRFVPFHTEQFANANTAPSVYMPNFHFTIWADNGATTDNITVKSASYAYFIEGETKYFEVHQPQFSTGKQQKTSVTTETAILTIRNKSTYASKTNFIDLVLENVGVSIEASAANNLGEIRLVRNATLGGVPAYTDINASDSIVDFDVAGTTVSSGKTLLVIPLAGKNDKEVLDLSSYDIILQPGETLTVSGTSANSATINGTLLWKELF